MRTEEVLNTKKAVLEYLEGLTAQQLVDANNTYCDNNDDQDERIFENSEEFFDENFAGKTMDAVRAASYGEYHYPDNFVKFDGYGNLESFNYPEDHVDMSAIADDILENPKDYDVELMDEEEQEEEETEP